MFKRKLRIKCLELAIRIKQREYRFKGDRFDFIGEAETAEILYEFIRTGKLYTHKELIELKSKKNECRG